MLTCNSPASRVKDNQYGDSASLQYSESGICPSLKHWGFHRTSGTSSLVNQAGAPCLNTASRDGGTYF